MIITLSRKWACHRPHPFMVHKEPVYFFCTRREYSFATPWLTFVVGIQA